MGLLPKLNALLMLGFLAACANDGRTPVTLYSPHGRDQLILLERDFEAANPDIDIRWLDMGSQEILDRIRFEKVNPQADIWFGGPTTIFDRGVSENLLTPFRPAWADKVDPRGVGPDDLYWPVYRTPAIIAFNSKAVPCDSAPTDWDQVLEPKWRDKILIRDPVASGTMRAIWGLIIQQRMRFPGDTAPGMSWLRRLDGQTKAYTLNPAILDEKLARQEGVLTLWDLPDILISRNKGMPFDYTFPTSGTVVIDDAIALVRGSRHVGRGSAIHQLRRRYPCPAADSAPGISAARPARSAGRFGARLGGRGGRGDGDRRCGLEAAGEGRGQLDGVLGPARARNRPEMNSVSRVSSKRD